MQEVNAGDGANRETVAWQTGAGGTGAGETGAGQGGVPLTDLARPADYRADPADIAAYQRDGVVLLRGAFADWAGRLRAGLERNLAEPDAYAFPCESTKPGEPGRFFDSYCNWQRIPEYRDFVLTSSAAAMAGRFMQAEQAQFFHDHAFVKEPGTQHATPWHQDLPYYCVEAAQTVSVYVALESTPAETAVRFVRGSHLGPVYKPKAFLDGSDFNKMGDDFTPPPEILGHEEAFDVLSWDLEPGDAVLFDFRTLHGSGSAEVKRRRSAFSTRWLGDEARFCQRPGETSPPYPGIGQKHGDPLRQDWFPVVWRREAGA